MKESNDNSNLKSDIANVNYLKKPHLDKMLGVDIDNYRFVGTYHNN